MYGTIFRFQVKPGREADVMQLMAGEAPGTEEGDRLKGAGMRASYLFKLDNGGYMGVAVFEDKERYVANANDPAQDQWYRRFRDMIQADPEWNDGEIVAATS